MERDFLLVVKFQGIVDFNSHAHVERDGSAATLIMFVSISTHTLTWSVTYGTVTSMGEFRYFNSHAHVERDNGGTSLGWKCTNFNSHAHVERDYGTVTSMGEFRYFNSHAHVERDWGICNFCKILYISTHTLTWSVTYIYMFFLLGPLFQLTRSRGA